jgi:hypothetical protein
MNLKFTIFYKLKRLANQLYLFSLAMLSSLSIYSQASSIDLGFCMNGSGSISASDFAIQKAGIQAALANPKVFPRNSSIGFSLVQYASGVTQVHIPYTVISSEAVAQTLINQVNVINQIQGCTNPGDGISVVMNQLLIGGVATNQKIICMFTDGLPNCGSNTGLAVLNAKNNGLDRFTVVAIEDAPFYYENDFKSYYNPIVFGGGAVTVARNSVEFANFVANTCLFPSIELIGLEVNQAIQDWKNSVELVEYKTTYVRAHVKSLDPTAAPAQLRLRAYKNGIELAESPLTSKNSSFLAQPAPNRSNWNHSMNFELPTSWTSGNITFYVEAVGGGLVCDEAAGPNMGDCKTTVDFLATKVPKIKFVNVSWVRNNMVLVPSGSEINELANRLKSIFPVSNIDFTESIYPMTGLASPMLPDILRRLAKLRELDIYSGVSGIDRIYYGVLKGGQFVNEGGLGFLDGNVSCGFLPDDPFVYGRNRHAHEIGHNLGRYHAGTCNNPSGVDAFPHMSIINGTTVATIGPDANNPMSNNSIYGLDDNLLRKGDFSNGLISPTEHFELMSYCGSSWRWISDFTYEKIRGMINTEFSRGFTTTSLPYLLVNGTVNLNNNSVSFSPFVSVETATSNVPINNGEYELVLRNIDDAILSTVQFNIEEVNSDYPSEDPNTGMFFVLVPHDPNIKKLEIKRGSSLIGSISGSTNSPSVNVLYPNGGEFLSGDEITISWDGSDGDNDQLTYSVQFSSDGGSNWETLITDYEDESLTIPLSELVQTSQGLIRVIVSDGFYSVSDISNSMFTTPNEPPSLEILKPYKNATYVGVQPVFFEALAIDNEEGLISGGNITWSSDINGFLGSGTSLFTTADLLSEGTHKITAIVSDGGGLTDYESVTIKIIRINSQPCSPDPVPSVNLVESSGLQNDDGIICNGETVVANLSGGNTYLWSNGSTAVSRTLSPSCTTSYDLTVTDDNGCTVEINTRIEVIKKPVVNQISHTSSSQGALINIFGNNFENVTGVVFNGQISQSLTVVSSTHLISSLPVAGDITEASLITPCEIINIPFNTPIVTSISPSSGSAGTVITLTGNNLDQIVSSTAGNVSAIILSRSTNSAQIMVMPGAVTGRISVSNPTATVFATGNFTVIPAPYPYFQQGAKLTNSINNATQANSVSVSANGNTVIVGAPGDNFGVGASWIYVRNNNTWIQQAKLIGTSHIGASRQGSAVSISSDGNTVAIGGPADNSKIGATWVFTRSGSTWIQVAKLTGRGTNGAAQFGTTVSISGDGNTIAAGGPGDGMFVGATWTFVRLNDEWTQFDEKISGNDRVGAARQGASVVLNENGTKLLVGGYQDNNRQGAAWVFEKGECGWFQQGSKLVGTGGSQQAWQGYSVSLSADGNTAVIGGNNDNFLVGAAWVFTWTSNQWIQRARLVGTQAAGVARQGSSVSLSADGSTLLVGGFADDTNKGATWVFKQSGNKWMQQGAKIKGTNSSGAAKQGTSVSVSSNGHTGIIGGPSDNSNKGSFWVYTPYTNSQPLFEESGLESRSEIAANLRLDQNIPNPATGKTSISFYLPESCTAEWEISELSGRVIVSLKRTYPAGENSETFDLAVQSGIYLYRLKTPVSSETRKMLILK